MQNLSLAKLWQLFPAISLSSLYSERGPLNIPQFVEHEVQHLLNIPPHPTPRKKKKNLWLFLMRIFQVLS